MATVKSDSLDPVSFASPVIRSSDKRGYTFVETTESWKELCANFPCFLALQWPAYISTIVEDRINGEPVVIQLWKGRCEKLLGLQDFPGGVGAEVGVYRRMRGRARPTALPFLPPALAALVLGSLAVLSDDEIWWPALDLTTTSTFTLTNPVNDTMFFDAGPETTYWLNKWIDEDSFSKYRHQQGRSQTPPFPTGYALDYTINGKSYPRWPGVTHSII